MRSLIINRELLGITLIALVFSTVLTLFIVGERPDKPLEILRNDAPTTWWATDEKYMYAFRIVFREDFEEVKVKFTWFRDLEMLVEGNATGDSIDAVLPDFVKIKLLDELAQGLGMEPERIQHNFWKEGWPDADEVLLLDYSMALSSGMKDQSYVVDPVYILVRKGSKITQYYQGVNDLFPEREWYTKAGRPVRDPRSSGGLEVFLDGNVTKYISRGEKSLFPDLPTLDELPPYGELVLRQVKKDQRLTILTSVRGLSLPAFVSYKEMIRIYLDGELQLIQIN